MPQHPLSAIAFDRRASQPLFLQIYEALRRRIISGELPAGAPIPPSRRLAAELGVSRSTVVGAYDHLVAEGYVGSRRGAGVFVSELPDVQPAAAKPRPLARAVVPTPAARPFQPGAPDMRLFPYKAWARAVARTARRSPTAMILAGDPFGDPALRQAIADHVAEARGIRAEPDRIVVTAGAAGGLELILRVLTQAGDGVALEDPGYLAVREMVRRMGLQTVWMPVDRDGATIPAPCGRNVRNPAVAMLTPSHQYPLGGTMPLARRTAFLNYAERTGCWLIEDDFDSEFRYAGRPIPALSSLDGHGRVIYVGTFAKLFSQALRVGYIILPPPLVDRFRAGVPPFGAGVSIAPQRALAAFMDAGEVARHIRRMRRVYAARREGFIAQLRDTLGGLVDFDDHAAGMQIVVRLTNGANDKPISAAARAAGTDCPPLSEHYAADRRVQGLLMGFAAFDPEPMADAMGALRRIIEGRIIEGRIIEAGS